MSSVRAPKRKGFPPNLYLDPKGYFTYRNPVSGKRKGIGKDKAVAFREARAANAVLANMTPSSLAVWVSGVEQLTLAQWVPQYKTKWIAQAKPVPGTVANAEGFLKRILSASFAWMPLKAITTAHAAEFLSEVERTSGGSAATNMRSRFSDLFRMAETKGLIDAGKNPVSATYTPDHEVKRERLTFEQYLAVKAEAPVWLANAMDLALMTAQRREDIATAKFADYRDGYLFVVQGKSQGKVRLQQDAAISLAVVGMSIADAVRQCRDDVVSQFMIHHRVKRSTALPGDCISVSGLSNAFKDAVEAAGIVAAAGRTAPSFHEIRSLSERLYRDQYGPEFAQVMLGHKTAKMTAKYDDLRGSGWQVIMAK